MSVIPSGSLTHWECLVHQELNLDEGGFAPFVFLGEDMDLYFKFLTACKDQFIQNTNQVIDINCSVAKAMVEQSQAPFNWIQEAIKK